MKKFKISFNNQNYIVHYIVDPLEQFKVAEALGKSDKQHFGLDIETFKKFDHPKAGLEPHLSGISLIQIYDGTENVYVFDVLALSLPERNWFKFLKHKNFVAHNAVFEIKHLTQWGFSNLSVGCSMLQSMLLDRAERIDFTPKDAEDDDDEEKPHWKGHGLDAVVGRLFDIRIDKKFQLHNWEQRPIDPEALVYAALDAVLTYKVTEAQFPKIKLYKMVNQYTLLKDMQHVIADMELNGMYIDKDKHAHLMHTWVHMQGVHQIECKKYFGGINLNSTKQLGEWLTSKKPDEVLTWGKTATKKLAFGKNALASKQHLPEIKALLEYKKTAKLISTYGESLLAEINPVTNRIHCSFTLGETRTGRLSSREPNLQNLPRESSMRSIFVPEAGNKLIVSDFNQIELRVAGEVSGDPIIRGAYAKGLDLHSLFAAKIYNIPVEKVKPEHRQIAKSANFGTIYGMGADKFIMYCLAATNGAIKLQYEEAKHIIDTLWKLYSIYAGWCKRVRQDAKDKGFVRTPMGKMRRLHPDETYTKAPNTIVQGGAFEVMAVSMNWLRNKIVELKRQDDVRLVNSVHDEIILEIAPTVNAASACKIVDYAMCYGMTKVFPKANTFGLAKAKICESWGEK